MEPAAVMNNKEAAVVIEAETEADNTRAAAVMNHEQVAAVMNNEQAETEADNIRPAAVMNNKEVAGHETLEMEKTGLKGLIENKNNAGISKQSSTEPNEMNRKKMDSKIQDILEKQVDPLRNPSAFMKQKYATQCKRHWDLFYKRNTTHFFKDRHWTDREFEELKPRGVSPRSIKLLEVGCGVGNFVFPLLKSNPELYIYCCDFSPRAVDLVKQNQEYDEKQVHAFVCDLTQDLIQPTVCDLDLISAIFVLSAIPPLKLPFAIKNLTDALRPGGVILFRDYALHDMAQLRFKPENRIEDGVYVRTDGTFSVFFEKNQLQKWFEDAGLKTLVCEYVYKDVVNRKDETVMHRIFVQAKFQKSLNL